MRLAVTEPDRMHSNLRHAIFVCDCGRASDQTVVRAHKVVRRIRHCD